MFWVSAAKVGPVTGVLISKERSTHSKLFLPTVQLEKVCFMVILQAADKLSDNSGGQSTWRDQLRWKQTVSFANRSLRTAFNTKISERTFERFKALGALSFYKEYISFWRICLSLYCFSMGKNAIWWCWGVCKDWYYLIGVFVGWLCSGQNAAMRDTVIFYSWVILWSFSSRLHWPVRTYLKHGKYFC